MCQNDLVNKKDITIKEKDDLKVYKLTDTFKISFKEGMFMIDFGSSSLVDNRTVEVEVVSKITFPDEKALPLLFSLIGAISEYEKEFDKAILPTKESKEDRE